MNLLVTGAWNTAKDGISELEGMGHTVRFLQQEKEALPCSYEWVEGVICNGLFLWHPIDRFVNLKYIQLTSAGFDRVPMDYVEAQSIEIHNARGVYSIPMAEYAVAGVLQLYKQMRFFAKNQENHKWVKHRDLTELFGKTVCIIGCGSVGTECAKRFRAFGCVILGIDLQVRRNEFFDKISSLSEMENILPDADIIILTVPYTRETAHLIDSKQLEVFKKETVLVNISRGGVLNTEALVDHHVGGVILDVFEEEPLGESSPIWDMENVIISPHNSFVGNGNSGRLDNLILGNLRRTREDHE